MRQVPCFQHVNSVYTRDYVTKRKGDTLFREFLKRLSPARYDEYYEAVGARNRVNMAVFVVMCMIVAVTNLISQIMIMRTQGFMGNVLLIALYAVLAVVVFVVYRRQQHVSTLGVYLIQAPVMLVGILMGTVLDPNQPAVTFLLLIVTLPLFILDKPWRVIAYETSAVALFILLCFAVKDYEIVKSDLIHIVGFYISTVVITLFLLADRFDAIEGYALLQGESEHDELTGLKNRRALNAERDLFLRMPVCVAMADIDLFKNYNDNFGHTVGDKVIAYFATTLVDEFGHDHCYRYGGDEVLVVVPDCEPDMFEAGLKRCQQVLDSYTINGQPWPLSFSCGFAHGQARNSAELTRMSELADELLYEAKHAGRHTIIGSEFASSAPNSSPLS